MLEEETEIPEEDKPLKEESLEVTTVELTTTEEVPTESVTDQTITIETEVVSPETSAEELIEIIPAEISQQEEELPTDVSAQLEIPVSADEDTTSTSIDAFESLISEIEESVSEDVIIPVTDETDEKPVSIEEDFEIIQTFEEVVQEGEKPVFVQELQHVEATEGQPVRFEVVVTGEPEPELTWFLDGEVIRDSPVYRIEPSSNGRCVLVLPESFPEDEGVYECQATNIHGTVSTKADLHISGKVFYFIIQRLSKREI